MAREVSDSEGVMKLTLALSTFETSHRKFTLADRVKIIEVVAELGLSEADFTTGDGFLFDTDWQSYSGFTASEQEAISAIEYSFTSEIQGTIHIHPTMIVAKKSFAGSINRGSKPYKFYRHFYELGSWVDKDGSSNSNFPRFNEIKCPTLNIYVPVGSECQCGERHLKST